MKALLLLLVLAWPASVLAVPSAPVNAPLAHPLAPNPHTSVGVFWIYTDTVTGRQWTGGTYKVKRCSGAACTPTTVVASGLTNADYQDTGLSTNTVYGYRYVANDGADSADSPTVYVTTLAADSNFVQFPNAQWNEVLGPLPEEAQIPFAWYNATAETVAQDMIPQIPFTIPYRLQGTGSITNGTTTLTGTGTFFREQAAGNNPTCWNRIAINGVDAGTYTINSNTSITLAATWNGGTQTNVGLSTNVSQCGYNDPYNDAFVGNHLMYYDSALSMWQMYFSNGDPQYMRGAIRISESIFTGRIWLGRNRNTENDLPSPRNFQAEGLMLLGAAGRTDIWDHMDLWLTNRYSTWISNYRPTNGNNLFNRENGYTVRFTSMFVSLAPDSFPRSDGTTTSANGTITVDGDLTDGRKDHWRDQLDIDVPGLLAAAQGPEGNYRTQGFTSNYAEGDYPYPPGEGQPFMSGLLYDALGFCWRNTALSTTARDSARRQVLKAAAYMALENYNVNLLANAPSNVWRSIWYFADGGTRLNPYAFRYGSDQPILDFAGQNHITQFRQSIPLMLTTLGWAFEMSGDSKYKTWADEMANAAFAEIGENTGGTGDGWKTLCNASNRKDFGQCYRTSLRYFGDRLLTPGSLGTPPTVTMPGNQTLTGGVNQAVIPAPVVVCPNGGCTYRWSLKKFPMVDARGTSQAVFFPDDALTTKLCGLEAGIYELVFYAIDTLGMVGFGNMTVTVGDGVFPPVVVLHKDLAGGICTTGTSVTGINVVAYSAAGRTLSHAFSASRPKDQSAPTITPSGTTGNNLTVSVSGLSQGFWELIDTVTDSAGTARTARFTIGVNPSCAAFTPPSQAHNTIARIGVPPDHVLPAGSTSTRLYVTPNDPEGWFTFIGPATGYTLGPNGEGAGSSGYMPTAFTHAWSQTAGPVSATITNGTTLRPDITNMTAAGTYTFQYSGTDQQSDAAIVTIDVTVQSGGGALIICKWSNTGAPCQ